MNQLYSFDKNITLALNRLIGRHKLFDRITYFVAVVVAFLLPVVLGVPLLIQLQLAGLIWCMKLIGVVLITRFVFVDGLRLFYRRHRPYQQFSVKQLFTKRLEPSFPSAHAACIAAMGSFMILDFPMVGLSLLILSIVVGVARVVSGIHFFIDVVAGFFLGLGFGVVLTLIATHFNL